jgi:hypothetical protein
MKRIPRRQALAGAAAIAAGRLLVPAQVRAAVGVAGRANLREHPGGVAAAMQAGQPLYAPPGVYDLPARVTLSQPIDLLGEASDPPTFRWSGGDAFVPGAAPVKFQNCRFADSQGYLVNMDDTTVEVPYIGALNCRFENVGGVIGWPALKPLPGGKLLQLEVRRVDAKNVGRGIMVQGGATVRFDIEDYSCDGYTRFGLLVGPSGPGGSRHQAEMQSGVVRRVKILNGRLKGDASASNSNNNNGVYIAGRNVELQDVHIENLGDGHSHDTEGLYTKVVHLRASNVTLINAGGNQGFYGCKGGDPRKPNTVLGSDTEFENLDIVCVGQHFGTGVWYQAFGGAVFTKVKTTRLTGPALRMHDVAEGGMIIREWQDIDARRSSCVFDLRGNNTVKLTDCSVTPPSAKVIQNARDTVTVIEERNSWSS